MIYVLTGGMVPGSNGSYRTLGLADSDRGLLCNDRWRVDAVKLLWQKKPTEKIIISGGKNPPRDPVDGPTIAEVNERELLAEGVPQSVMSRDDGGNSTYTQLRYLATLDLSSPVYVVSSEWHLPRVSAMILYAPGLEKLRAPYANLVLVSAEEILTSLGPDAWRAEVERVRKMEEYAKRAASEAEGIRQIITGVYRFPKL